MKGSTGASISVLNLMEVVQSTNDATGDGVVACEYFRALCQQALPGPMVGGNVGNKDLNKWIDDRIANCESSDMYYSNKRENLKLLLCLLKLACQHYGKLRSPFGTDTLLKVNKILLHIYFKLIIRWICVMGFKIWFRATYVCLILGFSGNSS